MRLAERCGVTTVQLTHAVSALLSGEEDEPIAVARAGGAAGHEPHEVFGVAPDAEDDVVRGPLRELIKEAHRDGRGHDDLDVDEIRRARDALVEDS